MEHENRELKTQWSEQMGRTTMTMLHDVESLLDQQQRMKAGFKDTEHVLEEHQKQLGTLASKVQDLLCLLQSTTQKCKEQDEELERHETALFAVTDKNEFGVRGLFIEKEEEQRFRSRLIKGLWAVGSAAAAVMGWIASTVSKLKGG